MLVSILIISGIFRAGTFLNKGMFDFDEDIFCHVGDKGV